MAGRRVSLDSAWTSHFRGHSNTIGGQGRVRQPGSGCTAYPACMAVENIVLVEVGARDGLQNEDVVVSTPDKIELINKIAAAGAARVEVASFVHPRLVPQMADAEAVVAALPDDSDCSYIGLVLNRRGLERALATRIDEVNFVVGASEGFNQANQKSSVAQTMSDIEAMHWLRMASMRP